MTNDDARRPSGADDAEAADTEAADTEAADTEAADTDGRGTAQPDPEAADPTGGPPRDDREAGAAGPGTRGRAADGSREAALAAITQPPRPPRPPRRTGVFVDVDDLREHVGGLLRAILGGYEVDAYGNYSFTHEGARIFVTVGGSPIGPQVGVFSVTNVDVDLTPDLAAFLLTTNHTLGFGAFSYDPGNRAVWLRHTLLGTTLDGPELQSAVASVATTAARLDHPIRDRFGGGTFADAPDDVQRGVEPPKPDPEPAPPNASGYL